MYEEDASSHSVALVVLDFYIPVSSPPVVVERAPNCCRAVRITSFCFARSAGLGWPLVRVCSAHSHCPSSPVVRRWVDRCSLQPPRMMRSPRARTRRSGATLSANPLDALAVRISSPGSSWRSFLRDPLSGCRVRTVLIGYGPVPLTEISSRRYFPHPASRHAWTAERILLTCRCASISWHDWCPLVRSSAPVAFAASAPIGTPHSVAALLVAFACTELFVETPMPRRGVVRGADDCRACWVARRI